VLVDTTKRKTINHATFFICCFTKRLDGIVWTAAAVVKPAAALSPCRRPFGGFQQVAKRELL
jgi:hypothetical protein